MGIHSTRERNSLCGLWIWNAGLHMKEKDGAMNEKNRQQAGNDKVGDSANNDVGPTEKLRESDKAEGELSVPGAQNPGSEEIKDEKAPNSE